MLHIVLGPFTGNKDKIQKFTEEGIIFKIIWTSLLST